MYYKWQSYDVWFLRYEAWRTEFFCHFGPFFALLPPSNPKSKNFEKLEKALGDIIILRKCTINDNHMMYGSWDMKRDRQNFLVILDCFLTFYPLTTQKVKILKKLKKTPGDIILHKCTKNNDHMLYCSWDMVCDKCNC